MATTENHPKEEKLQKAKYKIDAMAYGQESGETYFDFTDTPKVKYFIQVDNPSSSVMPALQCGIMLTDDERLLIQEHRNDLTIQLKMTKLDMVWDEEISEYNVESETPIFDLKFQAHINNEDSTKIKTEDKNVNEEDEDGNMTGDINAMNHSEIVDFSLSCTDFRNEFKKSINFNHTTPGDSSATVFGAMALGISKVIKTSNTVIFQKPDNEKSYQQIISPVWNLKDFCNYMQTVYGVYDTGLIVYRDLHYLYIIPRYSEDYAVAKNDYNAVFGYIYDNDVAVNSETKIGYYKDDDNSRYVTMQPAKYKFGNLQEFSKEVIGNKFKVISNSSEESSVTYEGETFGGASPFEDFETGVEGSTSTADDRVRYLNSALNNPTEVKSFMFDAKLNTIACQMTFRDVDVDIFTFNRVYNFIFNDDLTLDAKYGGKFKLLNVRKTITQEDGMNPMNCTVVATFAKMN